MKNITKCLGSRLLLCAILLFSLHPHIASAEEYPARKRVGVVLSGGGAKGFVHVGALKVLEEAGIPIDYIAGTSMGAIIGGLYSVGYSPQTLDSLIRAQSWPDLLGDRVSRRDMPLSEREMRDRYLLRVPLTGDKKIAMPSGFVSGTNVMNLLTQLTLDYQDSISFTKDLPIPFTCVAYDIGSGQAVELNKGYLAEAIRASMSIPGAFEPVRIDSMLLIDGGIANNFPSNVVRDMGADILIGVDVAMGSKPSEELKNVADLFAQITWYTGLESYEENRAMLDLYVHPDIESYHAGSFAADAIDSLLVRGERAMREKWDDLIALKQQIGIPEDYTPPLRDSVAMDETIHIGCIKFEGLQRYRRSTLRDVAAIREDSEVSPDELQSAVLRLQGVGGLSEVTFRLEGEEPRTLVYTVKENTRSFINLGFRFDSEEMAAVLLNASFGWAAVPNARMDVTGRLSESPYAQISFMLGNETERKLTLSYRYKYNNVDLYERGDKISDMDFSQHTVDLNYSLLRLHHFYPRVGINFNYYDYSSTLSTQRFELDVRSERLISYYLMLRYDSFDDRYAPRKGLFINAEYNFYTTDMITNRGHKPFSAVDFDARAAISASRRVTFLPGIFARVLIGKNIPYPALNMMGGKVEGRYMPQQIAFTGMNHFELMAHSLAGARFDLRVRLWRKNYVSLLTNYVRESNDFFDMADGRNWWGVGLAYSYRTIIGPLNLQVDYSNRTKSVGLYASIGYYF